MSRRPDLHGRRVLLRSPIPSDALDRLRCGRDRHYVRMCGGDYRDIATLTREQAEAWLAEQHAHEHGWCMEYEGRCIGSAGLHTLDQVNRHARYAIGIFDASARGIGLGSEATRLILGYAFCTLNLHRVALRVLSYNQQAISCYRQCGFIIEGVEREGALIAGEYESDTWMGILEQEYRRLAPR